MESLYSTVIRRQIRLGRYKNTLASDYQQAIKKADNKYLFRIKRLLASMTERDIKAFQTNRKTKRAEQLRKLLDQWTGAYKAAIKVPMATGYDEIYRAEKNAIPGKKVKDVDKPPRLIMGKTLPAITATSAKKFRDYTDTRVKQAMADSLDPYLALEGSKEIGYRDGAVSARDRSADAWIASAIFAGAAAGRKIAYNCLLYTSDAADDN